MISEGSQADREKFIAKFIDIYSVKYAETQKMLKQGGHMTQMSEGGTLLFIDYSRGKSLGALEEVEPGLDGNLRIIGNAFQESYGTDAENVFQGVSREAGYSTNVFSSSSSAVETNQKYTQPASKKKK